MARAPIAGTGRLDLECVDVSLFKRPDTERTFDSFLLAAPFPLVVEVKDFFPLEEGIPTLAYAVRLVPPFFFAMPKFVKTPALAATATVYAQMK